MVLWFASTSLIPGTLSVPVELRDAMRESLVTYVRVGVTGKLDADDTKDLVLCRCQQLAIQSRSPYYCLSDTFNRCWLPRVPSLTPSVPPTLALQTYPDFEYATDIENADARLFNCALTRSSHHVFFASDLVDVSEHVNYHNFG